MLKKTEVRSPANEARAIISAQIGRPERIGGTSPVTTNGAQDKPQRS